MKTIDMGDATAPLAKYVRDARRKPVVVTRRGKPLAVLVPVDSDVWEDFVVSQHPAFIEVIRRSEARYRTEGGVSLENVRRRYAPRVRRGRRNRRKA